MLDPYVPTHDRKVLQWLKESTTACQRMDAIDREGGHATPIGSGLANCLRTAITALCVGYSAKSWKEVGEATFLIIQAEHLARQLEAQVQIVVKE